jgi:dTDP-L-rhamnose 4-epimerase
VRALITGGAGFIGSHTADALLASGCSVRVLDSLEPPVHPNRRPPEYLDARIDLRIADVRNEDALLDALRDVDVVYHLAAFQDYLPVFSRYFDVNVTSTARLYELIVREKLPIKKVIAASSQAALGEGLYRDANGKEIMPDIRPDEQLARGVWEIEVPPGFRGPLEWQPTDETHSNPQPVCHEQDRRGDDRAKPRQAVRHPDRRHALLDRSGPAPELLQRL